MKYEIKICQSCDKEEAVKNMRFCESCLERGRKSVIAQLQIPKRFKGASLENFKLFLSDKNNNESIKRKLQFLKKYSEEFTSSSPNILMYGPTGTGKTHLAVATLKLIALNRGYSGRYIVLSQILMDIRNGFNDKKGVQEAPFLRYLSSKEIPLLVIDDVGSENDSEHEMKVLQAIIVGRYNNILPTIVTTNKGKEEMFSVFYERAVDRLIGEDGVMMECSWPSFRTNRSLFKI